MAPTGPYWLDSLVCPETQQSLTLMSRTQAEEWIGPPLMPLRNSPEAGSEPSPFGVTERVLVRNDRSRAYPIVDGIPILLIPEALGREHRQFNLSTAKYAEAYEEMEHYNRIATELAGNMTNTLFYRMMEPILNTGQLQRALFPRPQNLWLDAVYDCAAQWEAYQYLSPIKGKKVLQLGGIGIHAVKFLLAGASEAWVLTPMLGEAKCAQALAQITGVAEQLRCIVAVAEEIPLRSGSLDAIYSGGCVHHMVTELALPEAARVLVAGGRFAAVDPWKAPLYTLGTRLLGKREPNVFCQPLTRLRAEPLYRSFSAGKVSHHGTLTRYPLLALSKFGLRYSLRTASFLYSLDDIVCSVLPGLRRIGSSVALLGEKSSSPD